VLKSNFYLDYLYGKFGKFEFFRQDAALTQILFRAIIIFSASRKAVTRFSRALFSRGISVNYSLF